MNKITRYTLLLSLSCLTSVPTRAEVVSSGDKLLEIISNNQTGSTVSIELGNNIILPQNVDVNGNAVVDGTEQKYKIDGNGGAGFALGNGESLTIQNTVLTNFGGQTATGLIVDNAAGGKVVLDNVTVESNKLTPLHTGQTYMPSGAFIANKGTMAINGTFNDNFLGTEDSVRGNGGFITNDDGHITEITGEFTNNTAQRMYDGGSDMYGGILWQGGSSALIDEIDAVFKNNTARAGNGSAYGGVMYINHGKINTLAGTYENNQALSDKSNAAGGVIFNKNEISVIRADFNNNKALGKETGSQYSRSTSLGGAIYNNGTIDRIENSTFTGNIAKAVGAQGGAIYNYASYSTSGVINEIVNTSFFNNQAENTDSIAYDPAQGGAIYQGSGTLTIKAENGGVSEFTGNTVKQHDGTATSNAVYMAKDGKSSVDSVLKLEAAADGSIIFNDGIDGAEGYAITVTGDERGTVAFNNKISNAASVTSENVTLALGVSENGAADLAGVDLTINSGILDLQNDALQTVEVGTFASTAGTGLKIDADLATGESDRINAQAVAEGAEISLNNINILQDGRQDITVFAGGIAPRFANLDSFAAYTADYKYTFKSDTAGVLSTDTVESTLKGLNAAVSDESSVTKSYSLADERNVFGDLGELKGGKNAALTINGNGKVLSGVKEDGISSYAGMSIAAGQQTTVDNVASVEGFASDTGGFIKNSGVLNIHNSGLKNNTAETAGGAVWSDGTVNVLADNGKLSEFSGNTAGGISNAVYMASADSALNLTANGGTITFNDGIDGANGYAINIGGNDKGTVNFNRTVANAGLISISGAHVRLDREDRLNGSSLTLNGGALHFDNGSFNNGIAFKNLTGGSGELHIDVDTVLKTADEISAENLYGTVNVVARNTGVESSAVYAKSAGKEGIRFAEIANPGSGKFNILRVENSAYEWEAEATRLESGADEWSMHVKKSEDGQKPVVVAEAAGYMGLTAAGFEQTRGMIRNIEDKTAATMVYVGPCGGYYDNCYNREPLYNLWISPVYASSSVDAPVKFDADVYGFEAGGDLQQDAYNRLGLFVSYRHGEYDLDGKNDFYVVNTSGDIDIDSYIGGLYYRYTDRTLWAMTTVFAGVQNADLKTADGVKADSDAAQFGATFSTGYAFMLSDSFAIEPRAGLSYTRIGWDDIRDHYGKTANYDTASQFELEAGIKFEKTLPLDGEPAKLYLQPGIVQVFGSGDKVAVSGLNTVHTLDDMTLGSVKGGVSYRVNDRINVFGNVGWLFGSDYENVSANFGLNYAF